LYLTFKSAFDTQVEFRFEPPKPIKVVRPTSPSEIDPTNFNLGNGTWTEKKARVERYLKKVSTDQIL
jgi:hypothetical protein